MIIYFSKFQEILLYENKARRFASIADYNGKDKKSYGKSRIQEYLNDRKYIRRVLGGKNTLPLFWAVLLESSTDFIAV